MNKKFISLLVAICLVIGLLPVMSIAENQEAAKAKIAIMGELDAVVCPEHRCADPVTGAAHSCGHHAQIASLMGVAYGLKESGVMEHLDGDVALMAVPAEEGVELEWRNEMMQQGKISYLGGKQEFIKLGVFDDVDCMIMQHTGVSDKMTAGGPGGMGFVAKIIQYIGKESHAAAPHMGVNALDAAKIGLTACDALRTTFKDEDGIRFHPIITKGGSLVNVVPAFVQIETFVRANNMEAMIREMTGLPAERFGLKGKGLLQAGYDADMILFDYDTRTPLCVIDLDTTMPGLSIYDFGDSIRFGANHCAEDEKDLSKMYIDLDLYEAYAKAFIEGAGGTLTDAELPNLFTMNDARQLIHITYGFILTVKNADGSYRFKDRLYKFWRENENVYAEMLYQHIGKHLALLYSGFNA